MSRIQLSLKRNFDRPLGRFVFATGHRVDSLECVPHPYYGHGLTNVGNLCKLSQSINLLITILLISF